MTRPHHLRDQDRIRATRQAYRDRAIRAGLCTSCRRRDPRPGLKTCEVCGERARVASSQRPRVVGCLVCQSRDHTTKCHGRGPVGSPGTRRAVVKIGPVLKKRLGVETVIAVKSSWLVRS